MQPQSRCRTLRCRSYDFGRDTLVHAGGALRTLPGDEYQIFDGCDSREATMRTVIGTLILLLATACCSPSSDTDVTGATGSCAVKLYNSYNPKDVKQCVDVCLRCDRGVATTCSTSCTLKGAH
jgi:hypothetical protein